MSAVASVARLAPKAISWGARYLPGLFQKAAPVAESIGKGLAGAGRGAVRPAIGGIAEVMGKAAPEAVAKLPGNWASRFAKRTWHSTVGKAPKTEAELQHMKDIGFHMEPRTGKQLATEYGKKGRIGKWFYGPNEAEFVRKSGLQDVARQETMKAGYGTLRGVGAGLLTNPKHVLKTGWGQMGKGMKGLTAGIAGMDAYNVATAKPEDRGKAIGSALVNTPTWLATGGISVIPQMAAFTGATSMGEHAGAKGQQLVGKFLGRKSPVINPMPQANLPNIPESVQ